MNDIVYSLYKTERRLEQFYTLLVKESLDREDVSSMEQENVKWENIHIKLINIMNSSIFRDLHEIGQAFRNSSGRY